jgi:hypothetical protein
LFRRIGEATSVEADSTLSPGLASCRPFGTLTAPARRRAIALATKSAVTVRCDTCIDAARS